MEEAIRNKRLEKSTKYKILVNYLKQLVEKEAYVNSEEIIKILKALEEVE